MNNYLDLAKKVDRSRLKEDDYFRTLVDEGTKAGILSEFDGEYIQVSLLEVLSEVCMSVTEKGNSSMRTEAAEEIAKSVIYTFSVAMKEYESPETALEKLKNEKMINIFYEGRKAITRIVTRARGFWAVISRELFQTENSYYAAAINDTAKSFFANYNSETSAHKDGVFWDYPLYTDVSGGEGAERGLSYLDLFKKENSFLLKFDSDSVHRLMCCLDINFEKNLLSEKEIYKMIPVNLFSYVFPTALGLVMCGKSPFSLDLSKEDVEKITLMLNGKTYPETVSLLNKMTDRLIFETECNGETGEYLKKSVLVLADELCVNPGKVFLHGYEEGENRLEISAVEGMTDSEYRFLFSQLLLCESEEKEIQLIKEHVKTARDFIDIAKERQLKKHLMLEIIKGLSKSQLLILTKLVGAFSYCADEEDRFVKEAVEFYLHTIPESEKEMILKMVSVVRV